MIMIDTSGKKFQAAFLGVWEKSVAELGSNQVARLSYNYIVSKDTARAG